MMGYPGDLQEAARRLTGMTAGIMAPDGASARLTPAP